MLFETGRRGRIMRDKAFGEWLVEEKLLRPEGLRQALGVQASLQARLDTILLDMRLMPENTLLEALGRYHHTRTVSRAELGAVSPTVARMISPRIAARLLVVPFRLEGKTLSIATVDPGDLLVEDELGLVTGCMVASFVALEARLFEALHRLYGVPLSPQHLALARRTEGGTVGSRPTPASHAPAKVSSRPVERSGAKAVKVDGRPPRRERAEELLEVSEDDLSLFPSLRDGVTPTAAEAAGPVPDRPQATPHEVEAGPDERLAAAAVALQNAEMRDDIADAVLTFCEPLFRRRMMLAVRGGTVMGWRVEGNGLDHKKVRAIAIPLDEPSVFVGLTQGAEFWLGPLPTMPRNVEIVYGLGGTSPKECFILPITVRDKTVCFLYGDNVDGPVGELPMAELRRLGAKASLAFQVYLMKSKIRTL
jgi:hypothetical protein